MMASLWAATKLSRAKLEALVDDLIQRTIEPCKAALKTQPDVLDGGGQSNACCRESSARRSYRGNAVADRGDKACHKEGGKAGTVDGTPESWIIEM
jgi:Hsp70 protein